MKRQEIGYLCSRGHYCFYADPEENGACGSKKVGPIYVEWDPEWDESDYPVAWIIADADESLAEKYESWRAFDLAFESTQNLDEVQISGGTNEILSFEDTDHGEQLAIQMNEAMSRRD